MLQIPTSKQIRIANAKDNHVDFMSYCWQKSEPFLQGHHTSKICDRLDRAVDDYRKGKSTFLIISVPFRHGKSDLISRFFPPRFLGLFPEAEVIVSTYSQELSNKLSRFARGIVESDKYAECFPDVKLSRESSSVSQWEIEGKTGATYWTSIGGGGTGHGYHLGVVDDFCKGRESAESLTQRETCWNWFTDVLLTRRAPVSITVVLATRWHMDDLIGRIKKQKLVDEDFPDFEELIFPAESKDYPSGYLFPERFGPEWYASQKATLREYGTAALLQCDPKPRGGKLLKADRIRIIDSSIVPDDLTLARGWDLASTKQETQKDDPDYTAGALVGIKYIFDEVTRNTYPKVYLLNLKRFRENAPERNRIIKQTMEMDSPEARLGVETVAGYKDAQTILAEMCLGVKNVEAVPATKDKTIRADEILGPIIDAGNFHVVNEEWTQDFMDEIEAFPDSSHDDQVDAVITALHLIRTPEYGIFDKAIIKRRSIDE